MKNPTHTYAATGNYTVTLSVTNNLGSDTMVKEGYFQVYDPIVPVAAISANKTSWSSPAAVQFYDRSTGFPTLWQWDFGDGVTADIKNPVHTYGTVGNYTVTLTVTNALGTDTITKDEYFHVYDPAAPVAVLSANKTAWSAPAVIQFYDRSTGFPISWKWDFGDGVTADIKNPIHTYDAIGNYTVILTVTNDRGSDMKTATDYIVVSGSTAPVAVLSANKTSWSAPAIIQFYDKSTGYPTSWFWDFGDGVTADTKNPVHTYTAAGNYTVVLMVTNAMGSDTRTATDYIKVSSSTAPIAAVSANKTAWSAPAAIQFYDKTTGYPTSWSWDFGDGSTANVKNPAHMYTTAGNYTVTLTATNSAGSDTKVMAGYILISIPEIPTASLSANRTSGPAPVAVQFFDRSKGYPTAWLWDFGDGSTSMLKNPVHTYAAAGNYTVNLTATNDFGNTMMTKLNYIRITGTVPTPTTGVTTPVTTVTTLVTTETTPPAEPLVADFVPSVTSGPAPLAVLFTDATAGSPTSWNWSFGDGEFSEFQNPAHTYTLPGNYTVCLTVASAGGGNTTTRDDLIVVSAQVESLVANFTADITEGPAPLNVSFTDLSTGSPVSWNWSFGDGSFAEEQAPLHTYNVSGNYTVNLTVADGGNATSSTGVPEYIQVGPGIPVIILEVVRADFSFNTTGEALYSVEYRDYSTGSPIKWNWSFGDGTFSEEQNPVHVYTGGSNFIISLNASNAFTYDIQTAHYNFSQFAIPSHDAEIMFSSVSSTIFQGESYLTDIRVKNTGSRTWSGDPSSSDYVYIQGLGGSSGDAVKFNQTHIPMLFENETVAPGGSYDFFFYMQAPDTIGNYSPAFQMSGASSGQFGETSNISVEVIKNPFDPVIQPNGSKLYTTTIGNLSSGMTVSIVGPKIYLDQLNASEYQDPRFLINPTLKSKVFNFTLNDTFNYADITIKYDQANVTDPGNLSISYFNTTTGNFTFVPSTVDTVNHTVTARVTHFSIYEILDQIKYWALPFLAQNDMGWMDMDTRDTWTINPPVDSFVHTYFASGADFPPGTYTILTSGSYSNTNLMGLGCYAGWATADSNQDSWSGMYIVYNNPTGSSERQVQAVRTSSGVLTITHGGGPIHMYNRHSVSGSCGSVSYQMHYSAGPVIRDPTLDYNKQLLNDALILKITGFDQAYTAYLKGLGCIIASTGQASMDRLQSLVHYALFLGNSLNDVNAFVEGYAACEAMVVPNPPVADFQISPTYGPPPLTVTITENSVPTPTEWSWNFGDETTSNKQNPGQHVYTREGTYSVKLTVIKGDKSSTKTRTVVVNPPDHHGYVQCSNMQDFTGYQDCVNYNGRAYCDNLCASERPECYIPDITGSTPTIHNDVKLYTSIVHGWEWQRAVCGQNAILNIAKEGNMDIFPSKNILSEWGYKSDGSCPNAGSSYAFENPGGKGIFFAGIVNNDILIWSDHWQAYVPFYHEVAAELKPGEDKNNINSWKFYNYGEVITPGTANSEKIPGGQIPKAPGADKCYTTIAIKKVSGWYGDLGYHYNSIHQKFWIDEKGNVVDHQNINCHQDDKLDQKICPCTDGAEYC